MSYPEERDGLWPPNAASDLQDPEMLLEERCLPIGTPDLLQRLDDVTHKHANISHRRLAWMSGVNLVSIQLLCSSINE